jgi:hypothetical protein
MLLHWTTVFENWPCSKGAILYIACNCGSVHRSDICGWLLKLHVYIEVEPNLKVCGPNSDAGYSCSVRTRAHSCSVRARAHSCSVRARAHSCSVGTRAHNTAALWGHVHTAALWGHVHTAALWGHVHTAALWGHVHTTQLLCEDTCTQLLCEGTCTQLLCEDTCTQLLILPSDCCLSCLLVYEFKWIYVHHSFLILSSAHEVTCRFLCKISKQTNRP